MSAGNRTAPEETPGETARTITRFTTQKTAALLAYLVFEQRPKPREILIEMLWPGDNSASGRHSLSMALSSLRHQLEPPGVPAGGVIVADRQNVGINLAAVTSDVAQFEAAFARAQKAPTRAEQTAFFAEAAARYTGPLLPGFYEEWILTAQGQLESRFIEVVSRLARLRETEGDLPGAIAAAKQGIAADPLRQETQLLLLGLLETAGRTFEALQQYEEFARHAEENNTRLGSAFALLLRRLQAGEKAASPPPALVPVAPPPVVLVPAATPPVLPSGTVTFLCADMPDVAPHEAAQQAQDTVRNAIQRNGGFVLTAPSDEAALLAVFAAAGDALAAAVDTRRTPSRETDRLRIALCTGDVAPSTTGEALETMLRRSEPARHAARILAASHGGQILTAQTTAAVTRFPSPQTVSGARFKDLGAFYLGDEPAEHTAVAEREAPEPLFLVEHEDFTIESVPPPLRARPAHRALLPLTFTRFFGRETEIAQLCQLLQDGNRLVTISGPGGTGKTRLSLQVAERLTEHFGGRVCFVPLSGVGDGNRLLEAAVQSLKLSPAAGLSPVEQIASHFAGQNALLVFDNLEQIATEAAPVLETLLQTAPEVSCLATSRRLLLLDAEREFSLDPLPVPPASVHRPEQLRLFESVQVFVDRAQAVRPDFQITTHNAPALAALCEQLEGLPLALELAAGRAQVLTPAQMLTQLQNRFDFLVTRRADRAQRHRSLRAAIEWSFRLLEPELARFWARLSVFRGGFTFEAAEAVCDEPLALDYLAQLRECSLISGQEQNGTIRFVLLETLRAFAQTQVPQSEQHALSRRHAVYFEQFAQSQHPRISTPEQGDALQKLEAEHDNLRAALRFSCEHTSDAAPLSFAVTLTPFWTMGGYLREGAEFLDAALSSAQGGTGSDQEPAAVRAMAISGAAEIAFMRGDREKADRLLDELVHLRRELGDERLLSVALNNRANVLTGQEKYADAQAMYEEALLLSRKTSNLLGIARTLNNLGVLAGHTGDNVQARVYFEESVHLRRQVGDPRGIAIALLNLGNTLCDIGDINAAETSYRECVQRLRDVGDKGVLTCALEGVASVACLRNNPQFAARLYGAASALQTEIGLQLPPMERARQQRGLSAARTAAGEAAFNAAFESGRALSLTEACREALEECSISEAK